MLVYALRPTADQVLAAYQADRPLMFLAHAFITVAIIAAALCLIRRRFDPMLVCLSLFAYLYGQRLHLTSEMLDLTHGHDEFFLRLRTAINYLVPAPAFGFFEAAGILGRNGKRIVYLVSSLFIALVLVTLIFGPLQILDQVNNILVVIAIPAVAVRAHLMRNRDPDSKVLRLGLLCFIVPAVWDNIRDFWTPSRIEPYGFALFLASLGYVAARRTLRRDEDLQAMRTELDTARRIQLSILPAAFPESTRFTVAARYLPMTTVAGDFYDYLNVDANSAGILIADVSGHGVPAALIASMVKMAATSQRANSSEPARLLAGMNTALCGNTQDQTVTAAYVYLDAQTGELHYAAAGHPPMLLLRDGIVTEIIENGLILAITKAAVYEQKSVPMEPGDRIVLYTDGILEARDAEGTLFGEENLYEVLRKTSAMPAKEAADRIITAVEAWARSQDDDLTVLVCDFVR